MSNEEKVRRLERLAAEKTSAAQDAKFVFAAEGLVAEFTADAALLREAAQLMREHGTLLTGPDWKGMYDAQEREMAEMRKRIAELEAERDAAKAWEARAVEALRAVVAAVLPHEEDTWTMKGSALRHVHRVLDQYEPTPDNQPSAPDYLAQQRREAAEAERKANTDTVRAMGPHFCDFFFGGPGEAEYLQQQLAAACREAAARELEGLMESEWKWEEFELKASIYARLADLRNEQPTACSEAAQAAAVAWVDELEGCDA